MAQMRFECRSYIGSNVRFQPLEVFDGLGSQNNLERHFGQNIANLLIVKLQAQSVQA